MNDWRSFLSPADEWYVTYAVVPSDCASVVAFSMGHTVELYLKAVVAKRTGKTVDEIRMEYRHKIKKLWDECKIDQNFMPNHEIEDSVFDADLFRRGFEKKLSKHDFKSYSKHPELYLIAKCLSDLKYFWTHLKSIESGMTYYHPNPYWIEFIRELRRYLGHPSPGRMDFVKHKIDEGNLPFHAVQYLQGLYV